MKDNGMEIVEYRLMSRWPRKIECWKELGGREWVGLHSVFEYVKISPLHIAFKL